MKHPSTPWLSLETGSAVAVVLMLGLFGAAVGLMASRAIENHDALGRAQVRTEDQAALIKSHQQVEAAQLRVIQRLEQQLGELRCGEKEISK